MLDNILNRTATNLERAGTWVWSSRPALGIALVVLLIDAIIDFVLLGLL